MTTSTLTKDENVTFRDIYERLPPREHISHKKTFVSDIAKLCKCAESTVRCWLSGTQQPDALKKSLIAEHLGKPVEELFPEE